MEAFVDNESGSTDTFETESRCVAIRPQHKMIM